MPDWGGAAVPSDHCGAAIMKIVSGSGMSVYALLYITGEPFTLAPQLAALAA